MLPVKSNLLPTVSRFFEDDWNNLFEWTNKGLASNNLTLPSVNIHEDSDSYFVEMAAPGLEKDKFKISLDRSILSITYHDEKNQESEKGSEKFIRKEYHYSSFQRSFNLNKSVINDEAIEAKYDNGVLRIVIPKREEAKEKPSRMIEIL